MTSTTRMPKADIPEAEKAALLMNGEFPEPVEAMWHTAATGDAPGTRRAATPASVALNRPSGRRAHRTTHRRTHSP